MYSSALTFIKAIDQRQSFAVETKSTTKVMKQDLKGLKALQEEGVFKREILVTQDEHFKNEGAIEGLHWRDFLEGLWTDKLIAIG